MSDVTKPDPTEWPFDTAGIWRAISTDGLFVEARPWTAEEGFEIADLTNEESVTFWAAVGE